jgi:hypothetical protein
MNADQKPIASQGDFFSIALDGYTGITVENKSEPTCQFLFFASFYA